MSKRLPPLQTLQAFEAAARHQSYSRAAEELALTHGAISHQVAALEARVGAKLFRRERNRMQLTDPGRLLLSNVRQALMLLERAFDTHPPSTPRIALTLSALPSLTRCWLVPRMGDFVRDHPDIDLVINPSAALVDLAHDGVDLAIRYGQGGWPDLQQESLMDDDMFPVCSPNYRGGLLPQTPADLADCTLISNPWQPWEPWLHAAGLDLREPGHGVGYTDAALILDAAAAGHGVALARRALVERDLAQGRLVRLFNIAIADPNHYFLVWRLDHPRPTELRRLRDWLHHQAAGKRPDSQQSETAFIPEQPLS